MVLVVDVVVVWTGLDCQKFKYSGSFRNNNDNNINNRVLR